MSRRFLSYTPLAEYECLMQQIPLVNQIEKYEKKAKSQFIYSLKRYMKESGYDEICGRAISAMGNMMFDNAMFLNEFHRESFLRIYHRKVKSFDKKDTLKTAIVYLLSADIKFKTILENYVSNPLYEFPVKLKLSMNEHTYSIYHAAKMLLEMKSGLTEEDLFDNEVLTDAVLCLVLNAKYISKYGLYEYREKTEKKTKQGYVNNSYHNRRQQGVYVYKDKQIRIK